MVSVKVRNGLLLYSWYYQIYVVCIVTQITVTTVCERQYNMSSCYTIREDSIPIILAVTVDGIIGLASLLHLLEETYSLL